MGGAELQCIVTAALQMQSVSHMLYQLHTHSAANAHDAIPAQDIHTLCVFCRAQPMLPVCFYYVSVILARSNCQSN